VVSRRNCGALKELAAASRKMTCHAGVAWHKENFIRKHSTRTMLNKKPRKYERRRRDAGKARNAKRE
jgi:hypothetical protein